MQNVADNHEPHAARPRPTCRTRLLPDVPTAEDEFTNRERRQQGPHQTVADAIAQLILPDDADDAAETKGISVGLEGSWGSGKTTVVRLLSEKLKGSSQVTLISFDAWAHEGDPLRRTFLETIAGHLQAEPLKWVDEAEWKRRIEELARRREVVETKDTPRLSTFTKFALATPLLVPVGMAVFGQALRDSERVTLAGGDPAWKFIAEFALGALLALAPVLLLTFKRGRDAWATILTKGLLERRTEITNPTANPTSIEFEKHFDELMQEALCRDEGRRIVLVLDNLDRVDSKDALTIWSTLQTFLQHRHDSRKPWYGRLWILVLYDPQALKLLWEKKAADAAPPPGSAETPPAAGPAPAPAADDTGGVAASFIDKSFQIRFEVPPPVLSNWRDFLIDKCLKRAFPDHGEERAELYRVYRVMFIDRVITGRATPTIRELKLYVNQIGALHRQLASRGLCGGAEGFTLPVLAYYVVLRRRGVDIADWVLHNRLPEPGFAGLLGDNTGDKLAALYYNVEVSLARQIILDQPIRVALQERGEREKLLEYAQNPKAFWVALERMVEDDKEWETGGPTSLARAAYSLDQPALLKSEQPDVQAHIDTVIGKFTERARAVQTWSPINPDRAEGMAALLDLIREKDFAAELLADVAESLSDVGNLRHADSTVAHSVRQWAELLNAVFRRIREQGWPDLYRKKLVGPLSARVRNEIKCGDEHLALIIEALCEFEHARHDFPELRHAASLELRELVGEGAVWRQLGGPLNRPPETLAWGAFVILREQLRSANTTAAAAFLQDLGRHFAVSPDDVGPDEKTPSFAGHFLSALARYSEGDLLFDMLRVGGPAGTPLVMECFKQGMTSGELKLDPSLLLQNWSALSDGLGEEAFISFLAQASSTPELLKLVRAGGFVPARAAVYDGLYRADTENEEFRKWLLAGMHTLDERVWVNQLHEDGELLRLARSLAFNASYADSVLDEEAYANALARYAKDILGGDEPGAARVGLLRLVPDVRPPRGQLRRRLFEMFYSRGRGKNTNLFHELFGGEIVDPEVIVEQQADVPTLLRGLLDEEGADLWLFAFAEVFRTHDESLLSRLDPKVVEKLEGGVIRARNKGDKRTAVRALVNSLKLNDPEEIVRAYEKIIRRWVQIVRQETTDTYAVGALKKTRESGKLFHLIERRSDKAAMYRKQLQQLAWARVKDEGFLQDGLTRVLKEVIEELTHGKFVAPPEVEAAEEWDAQP
jgi:hypothetical protein